MNRIFTAFTFFTFSLLSIACYAAAPVITGVSIPAGNYKIGSVITLTITSDGTGYTLGTSSVNGVTPTNLQSAGGNNYTIDYTVVAGNPDRASVGAIPISIILVSGATPSPAFTAAPTSGGTVTLDANAPAISNVTIPNSSMKIGDIVTATITVGDDGGQTYTLNASTIGGFTLGSLNRVNNTTYTATFTITNGGTDVAAGTDIPVSISLSDLATNPSTAYTIAISQAGDPIDANAPTISNVTIPNSSMKIGDVVTATITVANDGGQTYTLNASTIGGFALGSLSRTNNTTYTATFTIANGGTDVAAGANIPVSVSLSDLATNPSTAYTTTIVQAGDPIDANAPAISNVTIPNSSMKIGDIVTATITVGNDGGQNYTLNASTIGGFTLGSLSRTNSTTYTATFTITNGGTDVAAGADIPVSVSLSDPATNPSTAYSTAISQAGDRIDANAPTISNVTIPNVAMKVGDIVTATITVGDDGGQTYTLNTGTIGGFTLGSFTRVNNTSYTATFTVTNGGTNVAAGATIPVNITIADPATNLSLAYTTAIAQANDPIDANVPIVNSHNINTIIATGFTFTINLSETGTSYYDVTTSSTVPTASQIKAGTSTGHVQNGNFAVGTASTNINQAITGLTGATVYYVYSVSEDDAGNPSAVTTDNASTLCTTPTAQPTLGAFSSITAGAVTANWSGGTGLDGVLVVARAGSAVSFVPSSGNNYSGQINSNIALATDQGSGNIIVYRGSGSNVTLSNLQASTTYHFAIYAYKNTADCYLTTSPAIGSQATPTASGTSTLTAGTGVATIASTVTSNVAAGAVFTFTLTDVGGDNTSTRLSQFIFREVGTFNPDLTQLIAGVQLRDNSGGTVGQQGTAVIGTHSITIPNILYGDPAQGTNNQDLGSIPENANKIYTLRVWFKTSLGGSLPTTVDGKQLVFSIVASDVTIVSGKTRILSSGAGSSTLSNASGTTGVIGVSASQIIVKTEPSTSALAGVTLSTQPVFEAMDANGNRDLDFASAIASVNTLPDLSPAFTGGNFNSGLSTFTDLKFNATGSSTMTVTSNAITSSATSSITVSSSTALGSSTATLASSPLINSSTGKAVLGFSLQTSGSAATLSDLAFNSSVSPTGLLKAPIVYKLFSSTTDNFGTASQVTTSTSLTFSSLSIALSGTATYFFLVVDVEDYFPTSSPTIQFSLPLSGVTVSTSGKTGSIPPQPTYTLQDNTFPVVSDITLPSTNPNNTSSVNFTVTFSEPVTGVDLTDFTAFGTASSGVTISNVTPSSGYADIYTVTVSNILTTGTLGLNLVDNNTIHDARPNSLGGAALGDGNFSSATTYTFILPEPTKHVTLFTATTETTTSIKLEWTDALGNPVPSGYLITVARSGDTATVPSDYTIIPTQTDLVTNTKGYLYVAAGLQTVTFSNLLSGETYTFKIYPYSNSGSTTDYNITAPVPTQSTSTPVAANATIGLTSGATVVPSVGSANINFQFYVWDIGNGSGDNAPTKISSMIFQRNTLVDQIGNWTDAIASAELSEGALGSGELTGAPARIASGIDITSNSITFSNLLSDGMGRTSQGRFKYYNLKLTLKTALTGGLAETIDGLVFSMQTGTSSITLGAGSTTFASPATITSGNATVAVVATQLDFSTQPISPVLVSRNVTSTSAAPDFSPVPVVRARDANGNTDEDYASTITISNAGSLPMAGLNAAPLNSLPMTNGVLTFPTSFQYLNDGTGTLTASNGSITNGVSSAVTVSYSSLTTLTAGATGVISTASSVATPYRFSITDDGGANLGDGAPTRISQLKITKKASASPLPDWRDFLDTSVNGGALIYDGTGSYLNATVVINQSDITISNMLSTGTASDLGYIGDGLAKNYTLYIYIKPVLLNGLPLTVDHMNFDFEVDPTNFVLPSQSSKILTSQATINSGPLDVDVDATKLVFTTPPPATASVDADISVQPIVQALDDNNNLDLDFTSSVTVSNAGTLSMTNAPTVPVAGVITFPAGFQYRQAGNGTLTVASTGLTSAVSSLVTVSFSNGSDISQDGSFGYPNNMAYKDYQAATIIQDGNSIDVERFIVRDGGSTLNDTDGAGTSITDITIQATNFANLRAIALYDGSTKLKQATPNGTGLLSFSGLAFLVNDNQSKTLTLRASFNAAVTDNQVITFQIMSVTKGTSIGYGSSFAAANGGGAQSSPTADNNKIEVTATQLDFTTPSSNTSASLNSPFSVVVKARDLNGNVDQDFSSSVTELTNASGAAMTSNPSVVGSIFSAGVLNFPSDFQFTSGNNNDDVTLSIKTGSIISITPPAPTTPTITLTSSFESLLLLDAGFSPVTAMLYKDFQDISTSSSSIALAQFKLQDGNGFISDLDGASTNIQNIQFSITNPSNIRNLGIYLGNTLVQSKDNLDFVTAAGITTVTFTSLSGSVFAPDNGSVIFTIRASFFNTAPAVHDGDDIQLRTVAVTQNGGSKFNIIGLPPLIGGINNQIPALRKIEVVATRLDFTSQPALIEGIYQPIAEPIVKATDINGIVDLDHDFAAAISSSATVSSPTLTFTDGTLSFTGFQYRAAGDGTLVVTSNGLSSITGGSTPCNHVDVINVSTTLATAGVISSQNLPGGAVNRVIFGATFNTPYKITGEPKLNKFIISFSNPISGIFTNIRVFESTNNSFDGTDVNVTSPTIGAQLTVGSQTLTVDFSSGTRRDLSLASNSQLTYFLVVDVSPIASGSTPHIQPFVVNNPSNIFISNGSVYSSTNTIGKEYQFASIFPPTLVSSYPASGQLNVDKNQPTLDLVFSVPVWSLDRKISLYDQSTGTLIQDLVALNGSISNGAPGLAGTVLTPLSFALPPLLDDHVYYINIAQGDYDNSIGIVDESFNEFPGFTYSGTLYFKTANPNPPILLNNDSSPVANNPYISNVTLTGATLNATFDQQGTAYFMVVNHNDPMPTNDQISGLVTYPGTAINRGSFAIKQVNPISQFGQINATLNPNTDYDVWMYAANNALPSSISTTAPYGGLNNTVPPNKPFAVGGSGPTLSFKTPIFAQASGPVLPLPQISICRNSYQTLNQPIQLVEGNTGDFAGAGTQTFNLLLPSGFQFDVTTNGTLILTGTDFSGTGSLNFINNTTLRVRFQNTGSGSRDNITISGLRVLSSSVASGDIVRLGGNALLLSLPDLSPVASLSSFDAPTVEFTNEYSKTAFPNSISPITIIPDDQGQVELIPLTTTGDYGPSAFSGSGVNINQLGVSAVTKDAPFNITLTHTDNNGCISQNPIQYTVYDHTAAIKGLTAKFCLDNTNFPLNATLLTPQLTQTVLFTNLGAHFMDTLKANIPFNADPLQKIYGNEWTKILKKLPVAYDSVVDPNDALRYYRSYKIDGAKILNANSSNPLLPNPYSYFINTTTQGNTYYDGGSLGFVEFTGQYQNQANGSVYIPLKQNVEFFVPAVPIVEVGRSNLSKTDNGVPIFCKQGGNIILNGYPAASVGKSVGGFSIENTNGIIHAKDLTVAIINRSNTGGRFTITLSKPAILSVNSSIQIFGTTGTLSFSGTHLITQKITNSVYEIDRPYNAAETLNSAKINLILNGFTDNSNGTAELNPTLFDNDYDQLTITYTYKSNDSPCESSGSKIIRVTPNPLAEYIFESAIGSNTPNAAVFCENRSIQFTSTSSIASPAVFSISEYAWDFKDDTNSSTENPNKPIIASPLHTFATSAVYAPELIATSNFGCKSLVASHSIKVGAIPAMEFGFVGVSTADNISFRDNTVINSASTVSDGFFKSEWAFGDNLTFTATTLFTDSVRHKYVSANVYPVKLKVTSKIGCVNEKIKKIIVVPHETPTDISPYNELFATNGGWQTDSLSSSLSISSWLATTFKGENVWSTGIGTYNPRERSALYSPSFDLSQLERPMISFNLFHDLEAGEGAVFEYSTDNRNAADAGKTWKVLGQFVDGEATGVDWYNALGLTSQPGKQTTGYGWTGTSSDWKEPKHVLDSVVGKTKVIFRVALATLGNTPTRSGVAIDNVRVGNRTRTVLVENFKNLGNSAPAEKAESDFLKSQFTSTGTKLVKLNYHVGFPKEDPFNLDNPQDPSARALFYNIKATPLARLDGDKPSGDEQPLSNWGQDWYNTQTLKLAEVKIEPTVNTSTSDGSIEVNVKVTNQSKNELAAQSTLLYVAVVERSIALNDITAAMKAKISSGETDFEYVVKKLLPSGAGTRFDKPLIENGNLSFGPFNWIPESNKIYTKDNLAVIVFLQDEITKKVYQAEIKDNLLDPAPVTGLENGLRIEDVTLYPNPADQEINILLPRKAIANVEIHLFDQMGKSVLSSTIKNGEQKGTLNVRDLAASMYMMRLAENGVITMKKVIVVHQN